MIHDRCRAALEDAGCPRTLLEGTETLETYAPSLSYYEASRLAQCLGIQIAALHGASVTPSTLHPSSIVRLDRHWYGILAEVDLHRLRDADTAVVDSVPRRDDPFQAPEITAAKSLPLCVPPTSCYYSAAAVICQALLPRQERGKGRITLPEHISGTPLQFFLERCMVKDPAHRYYMLI